MKKAALILISICILSAAFPSLAIEFKSPTGDITLEELIGRIIDIFFYIVIIAAPLAAIVAAFFFVTAGSDPKNIERAKKILWYVFLAVIIVLLAKGLAQVLKYVIVGKK